jgi:hypothetical protein
MGCAAQRWLVGRAAGITSATQTYPTHSKEVDLRKSSSHNIGC